MKVKPTGNYISDYFSMKIYQLYHHSSRCFSTTYFSTTKFSGAYYFYSSETLFPSIPYTLKFSSIYLGAHKYTVVITPMKSNTLITKNSNDSLKKSG